MSDDMKNMMMDISNELDRLGCPKLQPSGFGYSPVGRLRALTQKLVGEYYGATINSLTAQIEAVTKERDELKETLEFMTNIMSLTGNEARRMAQKALAKMEGKK